jgi:cytochrome c oxidase cbb3-type subunit 1
MWRTYTESDTLAYSFVDTLVAMYPYYIARTLGGLLFLLGAIVGSFNIWMTVRRGIPTHEAVGSGEYVAADAVPNPAE